MESTGQRGRIQVSSETRNLLVKAGKGHWVQERNEKVWAKGLGHIQTYWINNKSKSRVDSEPSESHIEENIEDDKQTRLITWMVDVLAKLLVPIVSTRRTRRNQNGQRSRDLPDLPRQGAKTVLDEVEEIVQLPHFTEVAVASKDTHHKELDKAALEELNSFVTCIAHMYRSNPFHNVSVPWLFCSRYRRIH